MRAFIILKTSVLAVGLDAKELQERYSCRSVSSIATDKNVFLLNVVSAKRTRGFRLRTEIGTGQVVNNGLINLRAYAEFGITDEQLFGLYLRVHTCCEQIASVSIQTRL